MIDLILDFLQTPFMFQGVMYVMSDRDLLAIFVSFLLGGVLFYRLNEAAKRY